MTDTVPERFRRRGRVRRTAGWTAAAVAVAGGYFWLSGGYDAWRHDRALDTVCDGDLAAGQVRALFPDVELVPHGDAYAGGRWSCLATAADTERDGRARVSVNIERADGAALRRDGDGGGMPLGHGWTGLFDFGGDPDQAVVRQGVASVLVDCGKGSGDGLLATAEARLARGGDFRDSGARVRLVAVLTETVTAYAGRTGCEARTGSPVKSVAVPADRPAVPVAEAAGTCAGLVDPATARAWGVRTVAEHPRTPAPVETCGLGGPDGTPLYGFTALYGPFARYEARQARTDTDHAPRLTAVCPGAGATALYTAFPHPDALREGAPAVDGAGLRAALKRFADRSAAAHGCAVPVR
ncbi:hypothetical protein AB0J57_15660 [Streptomyces sp. NPDC049837]|uniref:hypothetical protein n=1 Tax=Streptomyces sp. NPDC049837 TaxID=3155277 RepID=UPI0034400E7F